MNKIYFKTDTKATDLKAVLFDRDESTMESLSLDDCDAKGVFTFNFDNKKFDHFFISLGEESTGKMFPGNLSTGIEYKRNEGMGKDLTYLFSSYFEKTGRVDNYVIEDDTDLSYREDKSKKISVFIPKTYDGVTPHDILYFFDAQNLFCGTEHYTDNGDPYGSWQLDIVLSEIHRQYGYNVIVVGVDNADIYRSWELFMDPAEFGKLSPLATAIPEDDFSRGYLDRLSAFMVGKLHNFIKERYCVNENNIGIGGSSMGGIASFYCAMREMGFYSYVLSYSPAFGLYDMSAFDEYFAAKDFARNVHILPKIHLYCGGGDELEENLLPATKAMKPLLIKHGYTEHKIFETYDIAKPHNEESWRLILPQSFSYLLSF